MKTHLIKLLVRIAPFDFLIAAIQVLGWDVAIPEGNDDDYIIGLITGRTEYVEKILDALEEGKYNGNN